MNPHFYNLRSRLGLINLPHRMDEFNVGVEEGGDVILSEDFLAKFQRSAVDSLAFPMPDDIDRKKYFETLVGSLQKATDLIEETLQDDEMQIVVGGDHCVAFSSLVAVLRRLHSHSVGHIHIDSHPDINTTATSPTGNFHGMWLRPFVGGFDNEQINQLVPHVLKPEQMLFIGNLDMDPEEEQVIGDKKIQTISADMLRSGNAQDKIKKFFNTFEHIHLDIDVDAFDRSIAPATGIPSADGLLYKDIELIMELFRKKEGRSMDLVEVNPQRDKGEKTVKLARKLILDAVGI